MRRLRLDLRELRKKSGGYFGSGESTGSVGVVTINLPRIAYLSQTPEEFYERLDHMMDIAARSLKVKRTVITKLMDAGLYPYTKYYLGTFDNHFSTIGLIGMNEVGLNAKWLRKDLTHPETQAFAKDVLNHMRERLMDYQEQYGDLYNLEATPAESTTYRLAKHDVALYPDIITAAKNPGDTPYYTNSSHLPVGYTNDIFEALAIQDDLQTLYTSGTVFHAFLGEKLPDWKAGCQFGAEDRGEFQAPLLHHVPHLLHLSGPRLSLGRALYLPQVWEDLRGVEPHHRLLPPCPELERRQGQEFKDRQEYQVENSRLEGRRLCDRDLCDGARGRHRAQHTGRRGEDGLFLFTTKTCPNCSIAKRELEKAGIAYQVMDVNEHRELVARYGIQQAPTLIVRHGEQVEKLVNASTIKKFATSQSV